VPQNHPAPENEHPDRRPALGLAATNPAPRPGDLRQVRHLEKMGGWSRGERLRFLWYRLRLTVAEMNYATRRMVELQAPWIADDRR
jgi:hypothetical protein